jgi:hypothetical protein
MELRSASARLDGDDIDDEDRTGDICLVDRVKDSILCDEFDASGAKSTTKVVTTPRDANGSIHGTIADVVYA